MAGEMRLAVFAAEDLVRVQVGVVDEAHCSQRRVSLLGPHECRKYFLDGRCKTVIRSFMFGNRYLTL